MTWGIARGLWSGSSSGSSWGLSRAERSLFLPRTAGVRLLALVCLLLVVVMSTVQVCHVHGVVTAKQGSRQDSRQGDPAPENHCPLCVAMHSAVPIGIHVEPEPLAAVRALDSVAADAERMFRWRFEMASRPPPAAAHLAS